MNSIQDILSQYRNAIGGRSNQDEGVVGDAFSQLFNNRLNKSRSSGDSLMDRLAERFPGVSVNKGTVPSGLEAAAAHYKAKAGDQVTVSPDAADKMNTDSSFASTVQEAIQAMLNGGNLLNVPGAATTQVGISVTVISIRYTEVHYGGNGDALAGTDWTGDISNRLKELIENLFQIGTKGTEPDETEIGESDETTEPAEDVKAPEYPAVPAGTVFAGWSVSVFYSQTVISALNDQAGANAGSYQAAGMSFGVGMANFTAMRPFGVLAQNSGAFYNVNNMPNLFNTPFFNGMSMSSSWAQSNNLFFNLNNMKSPLSDLWNLLDSAREGVKPVEAETVGEGETVLDDAVAPVA